VKPETIKEYLAQEKGLADYKFTIEQILRAKEHILPAEQQKIVSLTGLYSSNTSEAFNLLNNVDIPNMEVTLSDGKKVTLNYTNYSYYRAAKEPGDRSLVMNTFWKNHKKYENTLASLMDAQMKMHLFDAKVGKYTTCLQARLYGDNIDTSVYYNLIKYVKQNLEPFHRYLKLKKELLKLDKFRYEDVYASAVKSVDKIFSFDEAKDLVYKSLIPLGSDYKSKLDEAFSNRWIDIYPNKDKESGAYSSGIYKVHPFVKMNFNGDYDAVSTLIHELGHSMHSYYTFSTQPYANSSYTTFIAEIASTFNESMLINYMADNEKDDLFKLYLLDNYVDGARGTIYRQALFAEFELAMHTRVEEGKSLTPNWLDSTYLALTREYYGHDKGVTQVDDYIQNEWGAIPHFFMNYYVFQYSTGMIASMALSDNVLSKKDKALEKYVTLLKSGASDYPVTLLKNAGVDMNSPEPYKAAFARLDKIVTEMEQLVKKLKSEGKMYSIYDLNYYQNEHQKVALTRHLF
ncbi:MAG: M3 family oligoendopeptidase, partial [Bacteroidota bacterium]|nr:M3 family oligoendopeptidase [Bacteroidota bacterium]